MKCESKCEAYQLCGLKDSAETQAERWATWLDIVKTNEFYKTFYHQL
jgi:hypothetical protein